MTELAIPTVHMNGTSKGDLIDSYQRAYYPLLDAIDALCASAPNGRDYYPQGDGALKAAITQHRDRIATLQTVLVSLQKIMVGISEQ